MTITFQINYTDSNKNKGIFNKIEKSESIKLFNEFDWEKVQNDISERLDNGQTVNDSDSIIFKNSDNIKLSIESFDRGIYVAALFKEKNGLSGKIPEIINGSPMLRQSEVEEIIQSFFDNDLKNLNNICDRTRENSKIEIGPNALKIEKQADKYLNDLKVGFRQGKINESISNQSFISWILIAFGIFLIYILGFRVKESNTIFKILMSIVSGVMILGGVVSLTRIKKHKNN